MQLYEADFNCYNQFVFGKAAMDSLNSIGYTPEELILQKGSTSKDATFNKTLMADLSRLARHPMAVVSADAHTVTTTASTTSSCPLYGWY
jgi:hypothetical protein